MSILLGAEIIEKHFTLDKKNERSRSQSQSRFKRIKNIY